MSVRKVSCVSRRRFLKQTGVTLLAAGLGAAVALRSDRVKSILPMLEAAIR